VKDIEYWKKRAEAAEEALKELLTLINPMDPTFEGALYTIEDLRNQNDD
jgi:alkanesulfonate monooxygenase SsuD/methylene tetrahydromethanopterin reductase-like flavin-dependent oxidoreductase (luciferase family)